MTIMPRKSTSVLIGCRFCHDMPRILPYAHCVRMVPTYQHARTDRRGGADCCNCTLHDSIVPGHSHLLNRLIVPVLAGSLQQIPLVPLFWHCGKLFLETCSSWRQTPTAPCIKLVPSRVYAWTCAVFRFAVVTQAHRAPGHCAGAPMTEMGLRPLLPHPASAAHSLR